MGNGQSCKIVGIGDVCLKTELGCKLLLKKVRHVPEIRLNLILTGQLDDEGYSNEFSNGRWKLSKGSLIVARDDHSRKVWAYPIRTKDHVTEIFKNFHVAVERKTDMKLRCVRANNSGEYRGLFENYCMTHGIKLEKTVSKTLQQNGLAKRMNRTIVERVHCKEVSYKYLRVFGCRASVHIPRDKRSKLDAKTIEDLQKLEKAKVDSPHKISILVSVDVEHPVEEVLGEYEETTTGGEIPRVDDDVTTDDTGS
ncbi:hypothetical protein CRG98_028379 [Punica granatum]|uniref:Integrase catalytic domain-containing protein n=1 Tax=Punica granatum TaxID=22663 RepID=A0A2I0J4S0_PUNGR|nr:hypothetical protein CRG98_028379 [Punica granatum]